MRLTIDLGAGPLVIEVLAVPAGNIPKKLAQTYYRVMSDERGRDAGFGL